MQGKVICIGLGPGDPELMSVRAHRCLTSARTVAFFRTAGKPGQARRIAEGLIPAGAEEWPMEYPVTTEIALDDPAILRVGRLEEPRGEGEFGRRTETVRELERIHPKEQPLQPGAPGHTADPTCRIACGKEVQHVPGGATHGIADEPGIVEAASSVEIGDRCRITRVLPGKGQDRCTVEHAWCIRYRDLENAGDTISLLCDGGPGGRWWCRTGLDQQDGNNKNGRFHRRRKGSFHLAYTYSREPSGNRPSSRGITSGATAGQPQLRPRRPCARMCAALTYGAA